MTRWTREHEWKLRDLIEQGHSYTVCAKRLGRTRAAVVIKSKKMRAYVTKARTTLSAHDVAQLLGIDRAIVARWIHAGDLVARNARSQKCPLWRITWEDLSAFLECRERWMAWKPERITDLALREWAQELRQNTGQWLTLGQVAKQLHSSHRTVSEWIREKRLPAVRYGKWWVHSDSLMGFVVPANEPYGNGRKLMRLLNNTPQPTATLAHQIGASMRTTQKALCRLAQNGWARRHGERYATWSQL